MNDTLSKSQITRDHNNRTIYGPICLQLREGGEEKEGEVGRRGRGEEIGVRGDGK